MSYYLIEQYRHWLSAWHAAARDSWGLWPDGAVPSYADPITPLLDLPTEAPPFGIESVELEGRRVEVDEAIVAATPFCQLRRFSRAGARRAVLLCVPLAGHAAVMMRETLETLLADGDVFVTDWINARDIPLDAGRFGLAEYVSMLDDFIGDTLAAERPLHVVAVCQATFPSLGAMALRAQRAARLPASLSLIGGPLDARVNPSGLGFAAQSHSLAWCRSALIDVVPAGFSGQGRQVFPAYLQRAEITIAYPQRYLALVEQNRAAASSGDPNLRAQARRAMREYLALIDMPAEYFLDIVDLVFQRACLANRTWRVHGQHIDPGAIRGIELLTVEGEHDAVTGAGQTHAALEMCSGLAPQSRRRLDIERCDHYGLFTGARWRADVHPALAATFARAERAATRMRGTAR